MNPSAESMAGWLQAEAVGRPLSEVFHIINEETRPPVASPVERVLREDVTVGLANHTLFVARDGTERPIGDSAAPIHMAGALLGVVLVFRDMSEETRHRAVLQSVAKRAQLLADLSVEFGELGTDVQEWVSTCRWSTLVRWRKRPSQRAGVMPMAGR